MKTITSLTIVALVAQSQAFAPSGSSTFVRKHSIKSYTAGNPSNANNQKASSSSLTMNLFDRFSRVAKANVNSVLKSLEDPEKILNQAVEDMQVRTRNTCIYIYV